jgi:glycosyltransferase involved in cell wall biosynthesis
MGTHKKQLDVIMNNMSNIDRGISIVIPTIGRDSINNLLKSIHSDTTLKNHEVIIVGSSSTINKILNLAKEYNCIKFVEQNVLSVSLSRNIGINHAKQELISLIDDDDLWLEKRTQTFTQATNTYNKSIIFGSASIFDQKSNKLTYSIKEKQITESDLIRQFRRPFYLKQKYFLQVGNCAFLKKTSVPKFRENLVYLEDQIWVFDVLNSGLQVRQIKDLTIKYYFSRERSNIRWSISNEKQIFLTLNELVPKLGISYISNISLKSLAISSNKQKFISARKDLFNNFTFGTLDRLRFLALSAINLLVNLK